jgi:MFS family permease
VRAIGLFTTVSAAGGATGLVAGGLLTEWASWRWVMFVNVPIGLAVLFVGSAVLIETPRRHGRFDLAGAVTSTAGMTAVVLGLVEAGTSGWTAPITLGSLLGGVALLGLFVLIETTATEPILPLRILANRTRASANAARGLGYAGMYGIIFFLTQFLQDIQGRSSLITGIGFLPTPMSVFLAAQVTSKVLVNRLSAKVLMIMGTTLSAGGLLLATQLHTGSTYPQVLASLILIGTGMGVSFVSLTTAGLAGVAPSDAGAASGLINVMQQLGAALGLAVLVTIFDTVTSATHTVGLSQVAALRGAAGAAAPAALVHGMDVTFAAGAGFALAALVIVVLFVRTPARAVVDLRIPADLEMEAA